LKQESGLEGGSTLWKPVCPQPLRGLEITVVCATPGLVVAHVWLGRFLLFAVRAVTTGSYRAVRQGEAGFQRQGMLHWRICTAHVFKAMRKDKQVRDHRYP
jgi:hypothetical protein